MKYYFLLRKINDRSSKTFLIDIGVAGNFLSELRPKSDGSNSISISINEEKKQIIFRSYPAVKAKFLELCPSTISEKEFWTEFFQSHYFHRDRISTSSKEMGFLSFFFEFSLNFIIVKKTHEFFLDRNKRRRKAHELELRIFMGRK